MSIDNYYFEPCDYLLIISYEGTGHPMRVERGYVPQLDLWLKNKENIKHYLDGCKSWCIRNMNGKLIKSSKNVKAVK